MHIDDRITYLLIFLWLQYWSKFIENHLTSKKYAIRDESSQRALIKWPKTSFFTISCIIMLLQDKSWHCDIAIMMKNTKLQFSNAILAFSEQPESRKVRFTHNDVVNMQNKAFPDFCWLSNLCRVDKNHWISFSNAFLAFSDESSQENWVFMHIEVVNIQNNAIPGFCWLSNLSRVKEDCWI